jgi:hypothetical protein
VGYLSGGRYVAIAPKANGDGTYRFTLPAGVTEALLVVKGDINGDGNTNTLDTAKVYSHVRRSSMITDPIALFAADTTGSGTINIVNVAMIYAHVKKTIKLTW